MRLRSSRRTEPDARATGTTRMRAIALLAPLVGLLTVVTTAAVKADSTSLPFNSLGRMAFGPNASQSTKELLIEPGVHRGFMVIATTPPVVRVFDTLNRRIVGDVPVPSAAQTIEDGEAALPDGMVDTVNHRIVFPIGLRADGVCPTFTAAEPDEIATLDASTLRWSQVRIPCLKNGDGFKMRAFTDVPAENAFYLIGDDFTQESFIQGTPLWSYYLRKIDATTGALKWEVALPSCTSNWSADSPISSELVGRTDGYAYLTCNGSGNLTAGTIQELLVKVKLDAAGSAPAANAQTFTPMVFEHFPTIADPDSATLVETSDDAPFGFGSYILNTRSGLFRGQVTTSNNIDATTGVATGVPRGIGLDTARGRLYLRTQDALVVADIRHDPLGVGLAYPQLRETYDWAKHQGDPARVIGVDTSLHRIFMPDYAANAFLVYDDVLPPTPDSQPPNPDQATTNAAEATGLTGATYSGAGDAYGAYMLSEGGPNRMVENALQGDCPFSSDPPPYNLIFPRIACFENNATTPGDRDTFFGHVPYLSITNLGVDASGAAADSADGKTAADLQRAGVYGEPPPQVPGQPTPTASPTPVLNLQQALNSQTNPLVHFPIDRPYDRPTCADFGGTPNDKSEQSSVGNTTLHCDQAAPAAKATSDFNGAQAANGTGLPTVGDYYATVSSTKTATGGVQTIASAWAHHISIAIPSGPTISIGSVDTTATTAAHGRPGTTVATFTRTITDVVTPTYQCTDKCDPQQVAAAITAAFASVQIDAVATAPAAGVTATPGGYQGVVTKDPGLQISDATVNDDPSDTVAGLAITYYDDGADGKAREVFQFAGVHAESHYGIYLLSSGATTFDDSAPMQAPTVDTSTTPTIPALPTQPTIAAPAVAHTKGGGGILGALQDFASVLHEGWRLLISDPKRAAMLAALWSLLLSPLYLAMRRRALVTTLLRGTA